MVDGNRYDRFTAEHLDDLNLAGQGVDRIAGKSVIFRTGRSMLKDNHVGPAGGQNLETARIGRIHQAALSLDDDDFRMFPLPGRNDRMFDFAGDEIIDQ